jgi:Ca2+-binding EF-hand superfamily protein
MTMKDLHVHIALSLILLTVGPLASAAETASFGTGGYASMLRTHEMMNKIDADGDGMVSETEWDTYQRRLFAMMDADRSGALDKDEYMHADSKEVASFATGGYANALRTSDMFSTLDADRDGKLSEQEFVSYHARMFDMMDTGKKRMLGKKEFIIPGH